MFGSLTNSDRPGPSLEADLTLLLGQAKGDDFPKRLFWELLSFDRVNEPLPFSVLPGDFRSDVAGAAILARAGTLYVCYVHLLVSELSTGVERPILGRLAGQWPAALVLFSNLSQTEWDFCWHVAGRPRETQRLMVDADEQAVRKLARLLAGLAAVDSATGKALPELELAEEFDRVFAKSPMRKRERQSPDGLGLMFRALGKWRSLTREEERELGLRCRWQHDRTAREKLVCANLRLVAWVAKKFRGMGFDLDDLFQEGCQGLIVAVDRFDAERGNRFATYAVWWIRQAIQRAILNKACLVRVPVHLAGLEGNEEIPTDPKSDLPAVEKEKVRQHFRRLFQARAALRTRQGRQGGVVLLTNSADSFAPKADHHDNRELLEKALNHLGSRLQKVIRLRYGINEDHAPLTLEEIGQEMEITRERVRQIEEVALKKLSRYMGKYLPQD